MKQIPKSQRTPIPRGRLRSAILLAAALFSIDGALVTARSAEATLQTNPGIVLKSGELSLDGKSTLHPYSATTRVIEVHSALAPEVGVDGKWASILQPGSVRTFEVSIPVASLKAEKEGLEKNMRKSLKSEQFPAIQFRMASYVIGTAAGEVTPIDVTGVLTVAGVERTVTLNLKARPSREGLAVDGQRDLLMTDFGIKPPKFLMGTLKTDNRVNIRFSLIFATANRP